MSHTGYFRYETKTRDRHQVRSPGVSQKVADEGLHQLSAEP